MKEKRGFGNGEVQVQGRTNPVYKVSPQEHLRCKFDKPKGCIINDLCDTRGKSCRHRTAYCQLIGETEEDFNKFLASVEVPA